LRRGIDIRFNTYEGCSLVHKARSELALDFLASDCTHIFWVDSDIFWKSGDFLRMVALGTKMDVVCAAYPAKQDPAKFYLGYKEKEISFNEYGCIEINHIAMGFSIAKREVIEALARHAKKLKTSRDGEQTPRIFRCDDDGEQERGEDTAYFTDIIGLGYKVFLDPRPKLGHVGQKVYDYPISDWIKECAPTP